MTHQLVDRRAFLTGSAAFGANALGTVRRGHATDHCGCEPGPTSDPAADDVKVRRNVYSLDPNGPSVVAWRTGVAEMHSRPAEDPTSWLFQANIHGTYDRPSNGMPPAHSRTWSTCEHSSYFFLSWHRLYLYFFERILRAASGDVNFALPYWNYDVPGQRALPAPLRRPADSGNPLFVAARRTFAPAINAGESVPSEVTSSNGAMGTTGFGSPRLYGFTWALERQPHNILHGVIGGSGWMSDPRLAARDPVFWLHHANIDRLWSRWIALGGGRENPINDSRWMETRFAFFDEAGARVEMTGADVLDTADQLGYRYDDEPEPEVGLVLAGGETAIESAAEVEPIEIASHAAESGLALAAAPVRVRLTAAASTGTEAVETLSTEPRVRPVVLEIGEVDFARPSGLWYEVYINLPAGAAASPRSPYYAGLVSFFAQSMSLRQGMNMQGEHVPLRIDITGLLNRQIRGEVWAGGDVDVSFVPRGNETPLIEAVSPDQTVTIGRIRILRQQRLHFI